jgi:hypothetical protein
MHRGHGEAFSRKYLNASVRRWLVMTAAVVALWNGQVSALTVLPATFDEMVSESQLVVHGRVTDVRSQTTAGRRGIETIVTVAVIDALKGAPGREVQFRMPNGQVGRYRRVLVGAPEFATGEEVVLFLRGHAPALPVPFGLSQGVYRISRRADGRAMVASLPVTEFTRRVRVAAGTAR